MATAALNKSAAVLFSANQANLQQLIQFFIQSLNA